MKKNELIRRIFLMALLSTIAIGVVYAAPTDPTGPQNITISPSSRFDTGNYPAMTLYAEAGNLTQLTITSLSQTQTWQGYYGEISGTITLDDASEYTLYDWYSAEPQGEIYAASEIVSDWETVHCFNYSNNGTNHFYYYDGGTKNTTTTIVLNLSELETGSLDWSLGLSAGNYDGVDETFNESGTIASVWTPSGTTYADHMEFMVGTINISGGSCPATNTYEIACINKTNPSQANQAEALRRNCYNVTDGTELVNIIADGSNATYGNQTICDINLTNPSLLGDIEIWVGNANYSDQSFEHGGWYEIKVNASNAEYGNQTICDVYTADATQMANASLWEGDIYTNQIFQLDGWKDGSNFQEVLLTINNTETIIYTTIIENRRQDNLTDPKGYNDQTHDFQMLVGDDGHAGPKQDTTTTYYFYVELE